MTWSPKGRNGTVEDDDDDVDVDSDDIEDIEEEEGKVGYEGVSGPSTLEIESLFWTMLRRMEGVMDSYMPSSSSSGNTSFFSPVVESKVDDVVLSSMSCDLPWGEMVLSSRTEAGLWIDWREWREGDERAW